MSDIDTNISKKQCKFRYTDPSSTSVQLSEMDLEFSNYISFAGASYYTNIPSASVNKIKELVRFFHEL